MSNEADLQRAREQAAGQYSAILEMVERMRAAEDGGDDEMDSAREAIEQDALSVQVRDDWRSPGASSEGAAEYEILLCTGGPAVRIVGELDRGEPTNAMIQFQDWFVPWTDWRGPDLPDSYDEDVLLAYVRVFYFGD